MATQDLAAQAEEGKDIPKDIPNDVTNPEDLVDAKDARELIEYIKLAERISHMAMHSNVMHRNWLEKHKTQIKSIREFLDELMPYIKDLSARVDELTKKVETLTAPLVEQKQ